MNAWGVFRWYLESAVLLGISFFLFKVVARGLASEKNKLRLAQLLFLLAVFAPIVGALFPLGGVRKPAAQIYVDNWKTKNARLTLRLPLPTRVTPLPSAPLSLSYSWGAVGGGLLLIGIFFCLARRFRQWRALRNELRALPSLKDIRSFTLAVAPDDVIPYSTKIDGRRYVVVNESLLVDREAFRLCVRHEMEHHRQGDFAWLPVHEGLHALFFWNPFTRLWKTTLQELQEFACDETLVRRRRVSPKAYGRCLIEAAEFAASARATSPLVAGVARASRPLLSRRLHMICDTQKKRANRFVALGIGLVACLLVSASALASRELLREGSLSYDDGRHLADVASTRASIPIVFNDGVLKWLNYYLGTPKGREFLSKSLKRMPAYEAMIRKQLVNHEMPDELLAIPLIESGYQNMKPGQFVGAGLWMFVEETARKFGLVVNAKLDERIHEEKETVAAMLYFDWLKKHFEGNWALAMAGYNQGENHVDEQRKESGVDDAWQLASMGRLNEYIYQAMAAIIILKNPSVQP